MVWDKLAPVVVLIAILAGTLVALEGSLPDDGNSPELSASRSSNLSHNLTTKVASFDWDFVTIENESEIRTVPFVKFSVDPYGRTNVSTSNLTAKVPVAILRACTHDGKLLWNLTLSGYAWAYDNGKYGVKANGTVLPVLLVINTSDYLYVLAYQTASGSYSEFRNYAPDDYFYIIGENGTVRKFDLGGSAVPIRNTFLVSNGSYVLMGFEKPQLDGSPSMGQVMILNGSEVIFQRLFRMNDPRVYAISFRAGRD